MLYLALGSRRFRGGVLVLLAAAWALPGPIVGLGLKTTIAHVIAERTARGGVDKLASLHERVVVPSGFLVSDCGRPSRRAP